MIAAGNTIQETLFNVIGTAVSVPVAAAPLSAEKYIRLDSFTIANDELYKEEESGTHRFTVHAFDSPAGGALSFLWVRNALATVHQTIRSTRINGFGSFVLEDSQFVFDPLPGEGLSAHGFSRYRVQIGG